MYLATYDPSFGRSNDRSFQTNFLLGYTSEAYGELPVTQTSLQIDVNETYILGSLCILSGSASVNCKDACADETIGCHRAPLFLIN